MGVFGKPTVAIVQARAGSTRLPGKVLLPIAGQPALYYVLMRAQRARHVDRVVLATSAKAADDPVAAVGATCGVPVCRGSEEDVVGRFAHCLARLDDDYELLVRICADTFLIAPELMDTALEKLVGEQLDIVNPSLEHTYPFGIGGEVATVAAFRRLEQLTRGGETKYREHVFLYAYEHPDEFRFASVTAPPELTLPSFDATVDTPEEFARIRAYLEALPADARLTCTLADIVAYFRER